MKIEKLQQMFFDHNTKELTFEGKCHDCKKDIIVIAVNDNDNIVINGGAVYQSFQSEPDHLFLKCEECHSLDHILRNYQPVQNYSRVVGYMRPVNDWNKGKQEEFKMRKEFAIPTDL